MTPRKGGHERAQSRYRLLHEAEKRAELNRKYLIQDLEPSAGPRPEAPATSRIRSRVGDGAD
jgi:hypothetical protein